MSSQLQLALALLAGGLPALVTAILLIRKFPSEKRGIEAAANEDDATALKVKEEAFTLRVDGYDKIFKLLMSRDEQILHLNNKSSSFELEIGRLTNLQTRMQHDLDEEGKQLMLERERRVEVEHQRDNLAQQVVDLQQAMRDQKIVYEAESKLNKKQILEISNLVMKLQQQILELKTDTQNLLPVQ